VLAEMIDRMAEFGALGLALLPKSLLHSMMLEAASRDVKLPDMLARAYNLPSNRLDAVLLSVGTLTRSEREVLLAMRNTGTFDDIAARTFSARNTVKTHARHIYAKLGVLGREEAVDIGETCGFFELGVPIVDTPNAISAQDH
jgi:DNA-binding NarL/FixJ family response regulator